jgi:uncharacterized repeat protein (TIGR03803 family)
MKQLGKVLTIIALALLGMGSHIAAAQESVLWNFAGNPTDGWGSSANLISDTAGNLYGTTQNGGPSDNGTVFELSPAAGGTWTEKVLYSFLGGNVQDGQTPEGSLVLDKSGNLYGTTFAGGTNNSGSVFELSAGTGGAWTEKLLYSFSVSSETSQTGPAQPEANLIFDAEGNLYGTSSTGGTDGNGTVFELSPGTGGAWTEKILYSFTGNDIAGDYDGFDPLGGLIFDAQGNLYGTTYGGGPKGFGTAFELSPGTGGAWTEKQLWGFGAAGDGTGPACALIFDAQGNLYGTAEQGGASGNNTGAVFELSPGTGGVWTEKLLWSFAGKTTDGAQPYDALIFDAQGNLYGTTAFGGTNYNTGTGDYGGTAFELTPASGVWTETLLHNFGATSTKDGSYAIGGLLADTAGNLYGTTYAAGLDSNNGIVYEIAAAGLPAFSPIAGTYADAQNVAITSATSDATIYYTTNGTTPTTSSTKYTGPIAVSESETIEAFAVAAGYPNSAVASAAYVIEAPAATPEFSPVAGTYTSTQSVTISDNTTGATIYYTTNGTTPTASSTKYTSAISVSSTETIEAIAVATGYLNSSVASAAYTINLPAAAAPTFSPAVGTYTTIQSVTLTDATAGATIYYTTNGTTPTTSSTKYTSAISVSSTETIEAIAVATGYTNSSVASGTYTINLAAAATPVFSPAAGTYTSTQSVAITDATTGAVIYYTTNGTTPTASSTQYSGAISVSATETIEAVAVATGYSNSAVASAAYAIQVATPSYTLSASPSTLTIETGSTGSTVITLTPTGGFTGTVNFACGTLPSDVTCSFAPASLTVASAAAQTTTLTIGTTGTSTASLGRGPRGTYTPEIFVAMILLPLGLTRRMLRARKAGSPWLICLLLLATTSLGMVGMAGCGGKSSSSSNSTPPGTYSIPINVTSGGTSVPLNLSITVQ